MLTLCLLCGCDEKASAPAAPGCDLEVISGRVSGGGRPVEAVVTALAVLDYSLVRVASAQSDAEGRYRLGVKPGDYIVAVRRTAEPRFEFYYTPSGLVRSRAAAEVVHVGDGIGWNADFVGGALDVRIEPPPELAGLRWSLRLDDAAVFELPAGENDVRFPILPRGTYSLRLTGGSYSFWLPAARRYSEADQVRVDEGANATYECRVGAPATIRGTVGGLWRELDAGYPRVAAFDSDSIPCGEATVDPGGSFTLRIVAPPSTVRLLVSQSDGRAWMGGKRWEDATLFHPVSGEEISGVEFVSSAIVCRLHSDPPLAYYRAEYLLADSTGETIQRPGVLRFLRAGFVFPCLHPGAYFLRVEPFGPDDPEPWKAQWYDRADSIGGATPIRISTPGEIVEVDVELEPALGKRGAPVEGDPR